MQANTPHRRYFGAARTISHVQRADATWQRPRHIPAHRDDTIATLRCSANPHGYHRQVSLVAGAIRA